MKQKIKKEKRKMSVQGMQMHRITEEKNVQ
jgi:hypothetical protein